MGLLSKFAKAALGQWNKPMTLGRMVTMAGATAAVPAALAIADHETNGALSYKAFSTTVSVLKDKIKDGADAEEIEAALGAASYIVDVSKTFMKGAQNLYVEQRMLQKDGADAIATGKRAAVEFQLLPDNAVSLTTKHAVRTALADSLHKNDRDAADKYIASSLIDDIVKNAQVIPLKGNQVTRDDVKASLQEILNNPEKHPVASRFFEGQDRLMNGIRQMWPQLAPATPAAPQDKQKKQGLSDSFDMAAKGEDMLEKLFALIIKAFMQMLGIGNKPEAPQADVKAPVPVPGGPRPPI